jgi:hypothetical protein
VLGIVAHDVKTRYPDYKGYMQKQSCTIGSGSRACDTARAVDGRNQQSDAGHAANSFDVNETRQARLL